MDYKEKDEIKSRILEDFCDDPIQTFEMLFKLFLEKYQITNVVPNETTLNKKAIEYLEMLNANPPQA